MFTAKEIADRLASPPEAVSGRVKSGRPLTDQDVDTLLASARSLTNQGKIDAMWSEVGAKGNAAIEAARPMFERVRHWTREGLLEPAGDKHPGTGRARLYDESALRKAKVLNSLTECGVTVRNLHVISKFLDGKASEWLTIPAGSSDLVCLVIQKFRWVEERDMQIRHLARGDNTPAMMFGKNVEYAIVVDLTQ